MPAPGEPAHDRAAELALQRAQVDVLTAKLARAERAVGQARTPAAAADAHRRADALLLEVEAAEHHLRAMETFAPPPRVATPARTSWRASGQGHLFDVG